MTYRRHNLIISLFFSTLIKELLYRTPSIIHNLTDKLLVQIPLLLGHVSQMLISLHSICIVPVCRCRNLLRNSNEYTEVHVQYPYIAMSSHSYIPLIEPQLTQCTDMGIVYYFENVHLLDIDKNLHVHLPSVIR